jgi:NTE family protein
MTKLGLVLGGGGVVGISWEIGVLDALAADGVLDPSTAATIIGTSAGSVVGARIAAGHTLDALAKEQTAAPRRSGQGAAQAPDMSAVMQIFGKLMTATEMTTELAKEVGAAAMAAPTGSEDAWVASFETLLQLGDAWPDADYRAIALSCRTGTRRAWTKDSGVPIARAVASSCAVPGLFPTVEIDGDRYTDGGAWSASNADLLADDGHDAVLFVGPIGGFLTGTPQVQRELDALPTDRTLAVLPGPGFAALQSKLMDPAYREPGLEAGRADGAAAAARVRAVLAG